MRTHKVKNTPFVQLQMNWSALSLRRRILRKDNKKMGILDAGHLGPSCREGRLGIELICAATSAAVNSSTFPKHIALIMDGNARWARERGIPILEGYEAGVEALRRTLRASVERRIQCLTVYALSIENLQRSRGEVSELFMLIERVLIQNLEEMNRAGIRLRVVGDRKKWPSSLAQEVARVEAVTVHNRTLFLTLAICYSGRLDIVSAVKELSRQVGTGILRPEDITEDMISAHLSLNHLSHHSQYPDIIIRTSGERRLSNFLLWESAYSELYFTDVLWPDFNDKTLEDALLDYSKRSRRYGIRH